MLSREEALIEVRQPALWLLWGSVVSLILMGLSFAFSSMLFLTGVIDRFEDPQSVAMTKETQVVIRMSWSVLLMGTNALGILAARKMLRLESLGFVRMVAGLACIPGLSACMCVGIPFGVWVLSVTGRPEVRATFRDSPP